MKFLRSAVVMLALVMTACGPTSSEDGGTGGGGNTGGGGSTGGGGLALLAS